MNKEDRQEFVTLVIEALEAVVLPRLTELEDGVANVAHEMKQVKTDVVAIRYTLTELAYKDEVRSLDERIHRIEKHLGLAATK